MPAGQRHALLQHLGRLDDGERGLLANARCLTEGVDVPTLDGVAFIDPRRSEVDIVQAVGRAIRLAPDKTVGTIVIPVFIDTDEDPEIALDDSAFKPVWDVIKALRSHDDELGEQLDELRRQLGRQGRRPRLPGKIHLDLPARVGIDFARAFDVRLVEQTTASWEFWFGLLEQFVERHGHARVPQSYTVDGYRLGGWVSEQRTNHAKGTLDADRERRLEDLPGWTWDPSPTSGRRVSADSCDYVERHGDARVPLSYTVDGYRLGEWVSTQRDNHAKGTLDADRQRRLQDLPGWTWDPHADQWEEGFSRLLDYVERHGDARVPASYTVDGYQLGQWVSVQRNKHAKGTLDADRRTPTPGPARLDMGPRRRPVGGGFPPTPATTSNATVTPASRSPTRSMATSSVRGSTRNAATTPKAPSTPTANADSRTCPAGHGTPIADQWEEGFRRLLRLRRTPR